MALLHLPGFASEAPQADPPPPFKVGGKVSRAVQKYTGLNALGNWLSSSIATGALRSQVGGKAKARVCTYSFSDLLAGKVKRVDIVLKDSSYRGIPIRDLEMHSATPIWVRAFKSKDGKPGVRAPILIKVAGRVHERDISETLASPAVVTALRMVKIDLPGMGQQQLQFLEPKVDIEPDKVTIDSKVITAGAGPETGVQVSISGNPALDASRIMVKNLDIASPDIESPKDFTQFVEPMVNPLIDLAKLDRADHAFRLTNLKVGQDQIDFDGNLLLAPRPVKRN